VPKEDLNLIQQNDRLRRENRILKQEREILKKGDGVLHEPKAMRFRFIEEDHSVFAIDRMCRVMRVCVICVVLLTLHKRLNVNRWDKTRFLAKLANLAPPITRCSGSLHRNYALWKLTQ
jgi:hypothetical protein